MVQCASYIPAANAKLPQELNLIYCLIYLDNIVIFSQMAEEYLHYLHIIFDQFRDHNLKLKLSKCNFLGKKSLIWHIESQRMRYDSVTQTWKQFAECALPQTYTEMNAFLGLVEHYRRFIRGFQWIAQPLSQLLAGEGASRKSEQVSLSEDALKAFKALK